MRLADSDSFEIKKSNFTILNCPGFRNLLSIWISAHFLKVEIDLVRAKFNSPQREMIFKAFVRLQSTRYITDYDS